MRFLQLESLYPCYLSLLHLVGYLTNRFEINEFEMLHVPIIEKKADVVDGVKYTYFFIFTQRWACEKSISNFVKSNFS